MKEIPSLKGTLDEAKEGNNKLILAVFNSQEKTIIMPRPETDEDYKVIMNGNEVVDNDSVVDAVDKDGKGRSEEVDDSELLFEDGEGRSEEVDDYEFPPRLIVELSTAVAVTPSCPEVIRHSPSHILSNILFFELALKISEDDFV